MPSWDDQESSDDNLLSEFDDQHHLSPRPPIPEHFVHPDFTGYENSDLRCKHDMPMYKYVCFEGEDTGRRFFACGCKDEVMCDKVVWKDRPWPTFLKDNFVKLWAMHDEERDTRIHGNVDYATKNYKLLLEKRELEKNNMELHKQLGNALEHAAEVTSHDLELEVAKRHKAEEEVASLKQERRKLQFELGKRQKVEEEVASLKQEKEQLLVELTNRQKLEEEKKQLEVELPQQQKLDDVVATLKEEKKKLEYYVADLLKLAHAQKAKMKKIVEICGE